MKLWYGEEKEGGYVGTNTLFIGSPSISYEDITAALKEYKVLQLYFGAGGCTRINYLVVNKCIKKLQHLIITLEVSLTDLANIKTNTMDNVNIIVTVNHKNISLIPKLKNVQLKLVSPKADVLLMSDLEYFEEIDTSTLKGKIYKGDEVIK